MPVIRINQIHSLLSANWYQLVLLLVGLLAYPTALAAQDVPSGPRISTVIPEPGFVTELTSVTVTFNRPVSGIDASDFLVNGAPAAQFEGTGATYKFIFPQPVYGPVDIAWGPLHAIMDLQNQRFDSGAAGSTWAYQLINPAGPSVTTIFPFPGITLRSLGEVEVNFNRPVEGIDAADLLVNGVAASQVVGVGAGPYRFGFQPPAGGTVVMGWARDHGIVTDDPVPIGFNGASWSYRVDPAQPAPEVVINEILTENQGGFLDEDRDPEDWIELHNRGTRPVDLGGWSLSVDREEEGQWVFPSVMIPAGGYLIIWASGKDRMEPALSQRLHTNFKLNPTGDTLQLFGPELPRKLVDEIEYPEQSPNHSYGRLTENGRSVWRYLSESTPGVANRPSTVIGRVSEVHFSVERGFFNAPFNLSLACPTDGAEIRYTLDGSPPSPTNGIVYVAPISVSSTRIVRAAAFAPNRLPSRVRTQTYLMNLANNRRLLPVLSLVTATNNLYGRTGIMEYNPRNTTKHGAAWERPVSVEWIRPGDNGGFQIDAGLRVAGGDYIRGRYNYRNSSPPEGKYSFRLYFRGEYGPGRLNYPIFPGTTVDSFNTLHLRAGMNDNTNPFIKDEFVRALSLEVGIVAAHGTFVYLFLNGVYKGLYNPTERVDDDFLQAYHGGGELWDVMGPNNQAIRGDTVAWSQLRTAVRRDLTIQSNYLAVSARMDLTNFVDYLLPLIWADNDDWPHNNTRAARERKPGAKFRFYPWDAEFAFTSHSVSYDTIATTLSTLSPPWGTSDYQAMFNSLKKTPEFKLLFADRVHRAFFNDGPLTDARIRARYEPMRAEVQGSIPGFNNLIGTWINGRRRYVTNSFQKAGFLASSNAPVASQFGGRVPAGYALKLTNLSGKILYTINATDPRVPFTSLPSPSAREYTSPITIAGPTRLLARSLDGTNWSALIDCTFEVTQIGSPIRITEIMFNPPGGDGFEFIELQNTGGLPVDLSELSFNGVDFRFPTDLPRLAPGARVVLANGTRPAEFQRRYPNVAVAGWFSGSLDNGGERLGLVDRSGQTIASVDYDDGHPWPSAADGGGASLEVIDPQGDPDDPANWAAGINGGTPGQANAVQAIPSVRINEIQAGTDSDWLELFNSGSAAVSLAGWSLTDNSDPRQFVFGSGTTIPPGGYLRVECNGSGAAGPLGAPFRLSREGETVALFDAALNRVDVATYGPGERDASVGWFENRWTLCVPTPLRANEPRALGTLAGVKINEFLANPDAGDDWIELHNSGPDPVSIQGCAISTSDGLAQVSSATFIPAGGFVVLRADQNPGPDHLDVKLPAGAGFISLLAPNGEELDRVSYTAQLVGITTGRLPDGSGFFQQLPFSPTPGASNYLAELGTRLRIAEVLARSSVGPDWVEIENVSTVSISLSGRSLAVDAPGAPIVRVPFRPDLELRAGERMVVYFGALPAGFAAFAKSQSAGSRLDDWGAVVTLRDSLDRIIDRVAYGAQIADRSIGRLNQDWVLLDAPTPGLANSRAASLDAGTGLRLNEWLAAGDGSGEFVELYNAGTLPVHLGRWVLTDDPTIRGSTNRPMAALTFIDRGAFIRFNTDANAALSGTSVPFRLDRLGETVRLLNPSAQIIDTVDFTVQRDFVSEGRYPDGAPRIVRFPGSASPGAPNFLRAGDLDQDGIDDAWELLNGLDPDFPADANADFDLDGASNLREFLSGSDPRDASSLFRISVSSTGTGLIIQFAAVPGRTYQVEFTDRLIPASWAPLASFPSTTAQSMTVSDPTRAGDRPTRFYRVVVTRP